VSQRRRWIGAASCLLALAIGARFLWRLRQPAPHDARSIAMAEARLYCDGRLLLALPTKTNLNVHALGNGTPASRQLGVDTFQVTGYVEADVFGEQTHAQYACTVRHVEAKTFKLVELRFRKDSLSLRPVR